MALVLNPSQKKQDFVKRVVQNEEERFNQTLEQGLELLNSLIDTLAAEKATVVPGTEVFKPMIHMDSPLGINRRNCF